MPTTQTEFPFITYRDGRNVYQLLCPSCGADGEYGVMPNTMGLLIQCPNNCGAQFMQRRPSNLYNKPTLEYVLGGKLRNRNLHRQCGSGSL